MNDRAALRPFLLVGGLVLALVVGFGIGRAAAPRSVSPPTGTALGGSPAASHPADGHLHGGGTSTADQVGGLSLSSAGYTLVAQPLVAGQPFRFRIIGPDRKPWTNFAFVHDKQLHLVIARRDLTGYRHLHPTMANDGTWSVDLTLTVPGVYRMFADFAAVALNGTQTALTLGSDLTVPGPYQPSALPPVARESTVDGMVATYEGTPQVGATQPLIFRVFANGKPMTNLERYLGSFGHLVVLREGDLGYVHVHPETQLLGAFVKFWLAAPSQGRYRMFFDFQVAGVVHTAEYTLVI